MPLLDLPAVGLPPPIPRFVPCPPSPTFPDVTPLPDPLPLPLLTFLPLSPPVSDFLRSTSSLAFSFSSLLRASSNSFLSLSCSFINPSFSISAISALAPFQFVFKISRELCSVCERMRVQVLRREEAFETVAETVCVGDIRSDIKRVWLARL